MRSRARDYFSTKPIQQRKTWRAKKPRPRRPKAKAKSTKAKKAFEEHGRLLAEAEAATDALDANSSGSEDSASMSGSSARRALAPASVPVCLCYVVLFPRAPFFFTPRHLL